MVASVVLAVRNRKRLASSVWRTPSLASMPGRHSASMVLTLLGSASLELWFADTADRASNAGAICITCLPPPRGEQMSPVRPQRSGIGPLRMLDYINQVC